MRGRSAQVIGDVEDGITDHLDDATTLLDDSALSLKRSMRPTRASLRIVDRQSGDTGVKSKLRQRFNGSGYAVPHALLGE